MYHDPLEQYTRASRIGASHRSVGGHPADLRRRRLLAASGGQNGGARHLVPARCAVPAVDTLAIGMAATILVIMAWLPRV